MMNILLCGDIAVFKGMELVIYSTMQHNQNIHWHIITFNCKTKYDEYIGLNNSHKKWFKFLVKFMDNNSQITFYNLNKMWHQYFSNSINLDSVFTPYCALRLLVDKIFLKYDRMLYLDCDVLVQKNLTHLYYDYANNYDFACVFNLDTNAGGFEGELLSGVMVLNLNRMRQYHTFDRAIYNYNNFKYIYPEQGALGCSTKPEILSSDFSYLKDYHQAIIKPTIIHFADHNDIKIYPNEKEFYRRFPDLKHYHYEIQRIFETYEYK